MHLERRDEQRMLKTYCSHKPVGLEEGPCEVLPADRCVSSRYVMIYFSPVYSQLCFTFLRSRIRLAERAVSINHRHLCRYARSQMRVYTGPGNTSWLADPLPAWENASAAFHTALVQSRCCEARLSILVRQETDTVDAVQPGIVATSAPRKSYHYIPVGASSDSNYGAVDGRMVRWPSPPSQPARTQNIFCPDVEL